MGDIFSGPGIAIISHADYDGWPQGDPESYVGTFENYQAFREWCDAQHFFAKHVRWQKLHTPVAQTTSESRSSFKIDEDEFEVNPAGQEK